MDFSLQLRSDGTFGLRSRYGYRDPVTGKLYLVPRFLDQFWTDGASVPTAFTWLLPRIDAAVPASVLHDALILRRRQRLEYIGPEIARADADRVFLTALGELGISTIRRHLLWAGVRLGTMAKSWSGRVAIACAALGMVGWIGAFVAASVASVALALLAVPIVAGAALGVAIGGDWLRPLSLGTLAIPLLLPVVILVTVTNLLYRGLERAATGRPSAPPDAPAPRADPPRHAGRLIFVSYAREDRQRVEPWVKILEDTGARVWWDNVILPGEAWRKEILDALSAADCVVVLWSKDAVRSEFILDVEVADARRREVLVQALLDDVPLPDLVADVHAASLFHDPTGHEEDDLIEAVERMLSKTTATS